MTPAAPIELEVVGDAALLDAATTASQTQAQRRAASPLPFLRGVAIWVVVFLAALALFRAVQHPWHIIAGAAIAAAGGVALFLWIERAQQREIAARLRAYHAANGPNRVTFDPAGYTVTGRHDRGFIGWPLIGPALSGRHNDGLCDGSAGHSRHGPARGADACGVPRSAVGLARAPSLGSGAMTAAETLISGPFRLSPELLDEGMDAVVALGEPRWRQNIWLAVWLVEIALIMLGALALTGLVLNAVNMTIPLLVGLGAGIAAVLLRQRANRRFAQILTRSRAGRVETFFRMAADGLQLNTGPARNLVPWSLVDGMVAGKLGLSFCTGGSFLIVPWAATEDPARWREAANSWLEASR